MGDERSGLAKGGRETGCGGWDKNENHAREARLARPGIGNKGGREKGFCDGDLERIKAKSTTNYGVQELSSASGCGSHS